MTSAPIPTFAALLQQFFTQRLMQQKRVSAHTIKSYRDTFRMLLRFAQERLHTSPDRLTFEMIDAPFISAFLAEMEKTRGVSVRTRNLRLTAIRSFFRYAAYEMPTHSAQIQRVLAMPAKRHARKLIDFLTRPEADALLGAPDKATRIGRRDHALLLTTLQTGMRLSEVTSLRRQDITFGTGAHIDIIGKGRKQRAIPLCKLVAAVLAWRADECRRRREAPEQASRHCERSLRFAEEEAHHLPLPPAYDSNGPPACGGRANRDRTLARTRVHRDHANLSRCRPGAQREDPCQDDPVRQQARKVPAR